MVGGDLFQELKTGHLRRSSPREQFFGQLIGTAASVFLSVFAYFVYSNAWTIGGPDLSAPSARIWLSMAQLSTGTGISLPGVLPCALVASALVVAVLLLNHFYPASRPYTPSILGIGIGFYLSPRFIIPRLLGALIQRHWLRSNPSSERRYMILTASGLVLGEGIMSIFTALLISCGIPVLSLSMD